MFIIHIVFLSLKLIYIAKNSSIILMFTKKITVLAKYLDFTNIFSKKLATKVLKQLKINKYGIYFQKSK